MSYLHLRRDDPSIESLHGVVFKIRRTLGTTAFGVNEVRLAPGAAGREHDESDTGHEEVYAVLDGSGVFTVDGERVEVSPGDFLRVDAGTVRQPVAEPDGLRFLAIGGTPRDWDGRPSL